MNKTLFRAVINQVKAHPESWNQDHFQGRPEGCATSRCIAGWAIILAARKTDPAFDNIYAFRRLTKIGGIPTKNVRNIQELARRLLRLSHEEARLLFYTCFDITVAKLEAILKGAPIPTGGDSDSARRIFVP